MTETQRTLDVGNLPATLFSHPELDYYLARLCRTAVPAWQAQKLVRSNESFGFALAHPAHAGTMWREVWDDPTELVGLVGGWGPEANRYVANAVRKLRAAGRTGEDTLAIVTRNEQRRFCDTVESNAGDGPDFAWGDFPWGGAAFVRTPSPQLVGVSGLTQHEDHALALLIGAFAGKFMAAGQG